jgi:acyl-[acyl-carrier-protein]-phospholipid O-acyltransferase/long-chain-fatty-acid--[acyl-carrier-protein] ligase
MASPAPSPRLADRSFGAFVGTQFLGAFNDNIFKQLILLLALAHGDIQGYAMIVFALPFILFSGYAGQLSEKYSKTTIMRWSKIAEMVIMGIAAIGFYTGSITFLLASLFFMGAQSTYFSPAKFGIIPELVENRILVAANGVVQMTSFAAIILGTASAGFLKSKLGNDLGSAGLCCVGIAMIGIMAVWMIVPRQANRPELKFEMDPFGRVFQTLRVMAKDRPLFLAMIANTFFYFSGSLVIQIINNYGIKLLELDELQVSMLLVTLTGGIMIGCLLTAPIQRRLGTKWTIFWGAVGAAVVQAALVMHTIPLSGIRTLLLFAGIFSGIYFVPIATFLQARPPMGSKGEVLAATGFCSWVGILLSGVIWQGFVSIGVPANWGWLMLSGGLAILLATLFPQLRDLNVEQLPESDVPAAEADAETADEDNAEESEESEEGEQSEQSEDADHGDGTSDSDADAK